MSHFPYYYVLLFAIATKAGAPYRGPPYVLPDGTGKSAQIEAESYDKGEEGDTYHDTTAENEGKEHRNDGVDIESCGPDCHHVSKIMVGEWMKYSIESTLDGSYDLEIRLASPYSDATAKIEIGDKIYNIEIPYSGSWQSWRTTTILNIFLPRGPKILKFSTDTGRFNLDYFRFIRRSTP